MKTTTTIHPNLITFWNSLAYPKLLVKLGLILFVLIFILSYIYSRPSMFIEHTATIDAIEFRRAPTMRSSDYLRINYRYLYKNKSYINSRSHSLPHPYPEEKVGEYVVKWRQMHPIGSDIKIIVNDSFPWLSNFSKFNEFKGNQTSGFVGLLLYFFMYFWFLPILILTTISMIIKYTFMKEKNDE